MECIAVISKVTVKGMSHCTLWTIKNAIKFIWKVKVVKNPYLITQTALSSFKIKSIFPLVAVHILHYHYQGGEGGGSSQSIAVSYFFRGGVSVNIVFFSFTKSTKYFWSNK